MKVEVFSILLGEKQADGILLDSPPDLHSMRFYLILYL